LSGSAVAVRHHRAVQPEHHRVDRQRSFELHEDDPTQLLVRRLRHQTRRLRIRAEALHHRIISALVDLVLDASNDDDLVCDRSDIGIT
jgi:hypothetical protein